MRRDSAQRRRVEIDDIFVLLLYVDELKMDTRLPKYVSDNPEQLPQLRLEKGDMVVISNRMDKLEIEMNHLRSEN